MQAKTFFDASTGQIMASFYGDLSVLDLSSYESYDVLEIASDSHSQYVENGAIVNMPEKPSEYSVFNYVTKQWDNPNNDIGWSVVRNRRNIELSSCDWTQAQDVQLPNKQAWVEYRQALRDITNQADPFNIVWPVKPTE